MNEREKSCFRWIYLFCFHFLKPYEDRLSSIDLSPEEIRTAYTNATISMMILNKNAAMLMTKHKGTIKIYYKKSPKMTLFGQKFVVFFFEKKNKFSAWGNRCDRIWPFGARAEFGRVSATKSRFFHSYPPRFTGKSFTFSIFQFFRRQI